VSGYPLLLSGRYLSLAAHAPDNLTTNYDFSLIIALTRFDSNVFLNKIKNKLQINMIIASL
jgi:hypothetical protein